MKYIRKRENGNYQVRIYKDGTRFSFTSKNLEEVIRRRNQELGHDPDKPHKQSKPKILLIDIETAPILAYVWGLWNQNIAIERIKEDWYMLSYAYKWLDDKSVTFIGLNEFGNRREDEVHLVIELRNLMDEADVIIAHNGDKFDIKMINSKFLEHNIPQPSPYKTVDTLKMARSKFRITSNKLDYLSKFLKGTGKEKHHGNHFDLWLGCMTGDKDSWARMKKYNEVDVLELERVYLALRGWTSHPNVSHYYNDDDIRCTTCGSKKLTPMKSVFTSISEYQAYSCNDCGKIVRTRTRKSASKLSQVI